METELSPVPFSYDTVVATGSRIEKGLLAIPVSLLDLFPIASGSVYLLDESGQWVRKSFTAYDSTSRECRIGGMRAFYGRYGVRSGDQLVIQAYGEGRYKLVPETYFRREIIGLETDLDRSKSQAEAEAAVVRLSGVTNEQPEYVAGSEYLRLAEGVPRRRGVRTRDVVSFREHVPAALRALLTRLYSGRCQVSGFSFLKKNGAPYFEVHHIDPMVGNHVKNVLVVSPNVHAQFTHAAVGHVFDESGWLRQVIFNGDGYSVFQAVDNLPAGHQKRVHGE